jgi:iron(III) transport system ATP-binding protein
MTRTQLGVYGVTKSFGTTPVLRGIDLVVERGQIAALLGPSGCGKTTLLRITAGFETPDTGTVTLAGRQVVGEGRRPDPPERRRVGIVPQEGALFPHRTVAGNVGFGLPRAGRVARIDDMLALVGLEGFHDRMPAELSGGQQQRVALARALAPEPELVLLDEPFNALDRALRGSVRDDVRSALRQVGATAVLVTHDQEEALSIADVVAVMRDGRIPQAGPPLEVYESPVDLQVASFVGETVVLDAEFEDGAVTCPLGRLPARTVRGKGGRHGRVALRPEQIVLNGTGTALSGRVERVEYFGHDAVVTVAVRDLPTRIRSRSHGHIKHRPGDEVNISVVGEPLFYPDPAHPSR